MQGKAAEVIRRAGLLLGAVGPGLFLIGYNIGTGSVTTMAAAGSRYGMGLFWLLVVSCVFTYVMLMAYGRFTAVSGLTAMAAFRKHLPLGKYLAVYSIIALSLGALAGVAGVMGIVVDLIREWTGVMFGGQGFDMTFSAVAIIAGCYYLMWFGRYSLFEKFLAALVMIMGLSFFLSMFMVVPEPAELVSALRPRVPVGPDSLLIMSAVAGTTCGAMLFVMRSLLVAEKGWTVKDLRHKNLDALVSVSFMLLLSGAIMACAAGTLFRMGIPVERAVDMVKTLEPIAGRFAMSIFVIGIIGAGVSSIFPQAPILPWLICDYRGRKLDTGSRMFRILGGLGLLAGLTVPLLGGRPVWIMIGVTAFQTTMMPIASLAILVLINKKELMGEHRAGFWLNLGICANLLFSLAIAYMGVVGLIESVARLRG
ncbi:MAG: divalent metal cation transporter [Candidatus Glassbacteria bacterium]|nr:divalent metal cation transporter [Candidatus Glassbacteria bacterium]